MSRRVILVALVTVIAASPARAQVGAGSARAADLERQIVLRPREAGLYLQLAQEYVSIGRVGQAETTLRTGLTAASDNRAVRAALIELLIHAERWGDAASVAEPFARDSSGRAMLARLLVNAGLSAYHGGHRAQAAADWRRALETDPDLLEAAANLGSVLLELGLRDSARAVATRGLARHPASGQLLSIRAAALGGAEGMAAAVIALQQMRKDRPKDEALGLELANLLNASGNQMGAVALYDTLLKAPGSSEAVQVAAANFEIDGSQFNAAVALVEKGLERFPRSGRLYQLLGEAEAGRSEWKNSAAAYRRASALLTSPEEIDLPLLDVVVSAGDTTEALAMVREFAARPASREVLLQAAEKAVALKAPAIADSIYAQLVDRDSADIEALEARGTLAERTSHQSLALGLFRRALLSDSAGPATPLALLRLDRFSIDSATLLLRRAAWRGMERLQLLELRGAAAISGPTTTRSIRRARPVLDQQRAMRDLVQAALDTMVFKTPWGPTELIQLKKAYPQSALLDRYAADLAARKGDDQLALAGYEKLLRQDAANPTVQRQRAALLEKMGKPVEAIAGYTRALDLAPEDEPTFRTLLRLRESTGTLGDLLAQVRRLRIRQPGSRTLGEHEVEILQRLDRVAEAQQVAKKVKEIKP
jgi:tetratricopeptide (TPR) repeat protein